jgi:hypothetical protein
MVPWRVLWFEEDRHPDVWGGIEENGQRHGQKLLGKGSTSHPSRSAATDGAPELSWLVEENRRRRVVRASVVPQPSGDQAPSGWGTREVGVG